MKNKIQELSSQASSYAYKMNPEEDSYGRPHNMKKFEQDRDEKFAELIIEEASKIIKDLSEEYNQAAKAQGIDNSNQTKALSIATSRIKAQLAN